MTRYKHILAMLLAIIFCVTAIPVQVSAGENKSVTSTIDFYAESNWDYSGSAFTNKNDKTGFTAHFGADYMELELDSAKVSTAAAAFKGEGATEYKNYRFGADITAKKNSAGWARTGLRVYGQNASADGIYNESYEFYVRVKNTNTFLLELKKAYINGSGKRTAVNLVSRFEYASDAGVNIDAQTQDATFRVEMQVKDGVITCYIDGEEVIRYDTSTEVSTWGQVYTSGTFGFYLGREGDSSGINKAIIKNMTLVEAYESDSSESSNPVASINGTKYASLEKAIENATNSDTIKLLDDVVYDGALVIGNNITLDLNGNTLTAKSTATFGGNVVDNSDGKAGRLKVDAENGTLSAGNSQMPIYIAGEGYMFATMLGQASVTKTEDSFTIISRPSFGDAYSKLAGGADAAKLQFIIRLDWGKDSNGDFTDYQEFVYENDIVKTVYGNDKAFSVTVNGLSECEDTIKDTMKVTVLVRSTDLEVEWVNNEFYMSSAN